MKIRVATRKSELALFQANLVAQELIKKNSGLYVELVPMTSDGDKTNEPLHQIGGKGLFIKTLESALINNQADIAVHSLKDVPARLDSEFCIAAVLKRASPGDMLISNNGTSLGEMHINSSIATSSPRRYAQIKNLNPRINIIPIRGNIATRIQKLDQEKIVLITSKQRQEKLLAKQLRAAYSAGNHDYIKLLLNQKDPASIQRTITNYQYINNARIKEIDNFRDTISRLIVVEDKQKKTLT